MVGFSYLADNVNQHATLWDGTLAIDLISFLDAADASAGWVLPVALALMGFMTVDRKQA